MIRSTLSISAGLAVSAVVLSALWIGFGPRSQGGQERRTAAVAPLSQQSRSGLDANGQAIRTITPSGRSSSGMAATAPIAPPPSTVAPTSPPASPERPADNAAIAALRNDTAPNEPSATAGGSVDLNTATVDQLNGLGAGMIGKRIIEFRPYTAPDELLTRRVLKRADFDAIKAAVTVR